MKEYIVTLHQRSDLENFYDDMETPGSPGCVPERECHCCNRRPISRNTHYMLNDDEVKEIEKDSRVRSITDPSLFSYEEMWDSSQTGVFSKDFTDNTDKNWGLWRCIKGSDPTWGSNGAKYGQSGTINTTSSGANVDVVICDGGHPKSNHPEFKTNPDGSGSTRFVDFNWFGYNSALGHGSNSTYSYGTSLERNHPTHVAGTAAGNTQGWARNANIYGISFYDSDVGRSSTWSNELWDYVRYFHLNKDINPNTGRRNPTVMNNSWGSSYVIGGTTTPSYSVFTSIGFRGTTTDMSSYTSAQIRDYVADRYLPASTDLCSLSNFCKKIPARNDAMDAEIEDAIDDGVIIVGSAGNSYWPIDVPDGEDYNNFLTTSSTTYYIGRGSSPGSASGVICVGSVGIKTEEYKSVFSNWDERPDIWAPGTEIISSSNTDYGTWGFDIRSEVNATFGGATCSNCTGAVGFGTYLIGAVSGTSMAGPQVAGVAACLMEQRQSYTSNDVKSTLVSFANTNAIGSASTMPNLTPYEGFLDGQNKYLMYVTLRDDGIAWPERNVGLRTTSGVAYPRRDNSPTFVQSRYRDPLDSYYETMTKTYTDGSWKWYVNGTDNNGSISAANPTITAKIGSNLQFVNTSVGGDPNWGLYIKDENSIGASGALSGTYVSNQGSANGIIYFYTMGLAEGTYYYASANTSGAIGSIVLSYNP